MVALYLMLSCAMLYQYRPLGYNGLTSVTL
jgi:hypothetical protein